MRGYYHSETPVQTMTDTSAATETTTATDTSLLLNGEAFYVYDGDGRGLCIPSRSACTGTARVPRVHPGDFPGERNERCWTYQKIMRLFTYWNHQRRDGQDTYVVLEGMKRMASTR